MNEKASSFDHWYVNKPFNKQNQNNDQSIYFNRFSTTGKPSFSTTAYNNPSILTNPHINNEQQSLQNQFHHNSFVPHHPKIRTINNNSKIGGGDDNIYIIVNAITARSNSC